MKKSIVSGIALVVIVLLSNITFATSVDKLSTTSEIIYIDDSNIDGPWDGTIDCPYRTINDGVFNSTEGDTIYVFNGTYYENIIIDKRLSIIGEGKTVIDGGYQEYVISIVHDSVVLKDLIIRNSGGFKGDSAIIIESDNNLIKDCEIYRAKSAISVIDSENNDIKNSLFYSNAEGITLRYSYNTNIQSCCFYHNSYGCNVEHSQGILINDCYANVNGIGFLINDSQNVNISKCGIYDNDDNEGGLMIYFCESVDIFNCNIVHNGFGINMGDNFDIKVSYSDILLSNHLAVNFEENSENITFESCEFSGNIRYAIRAAGGSCKLRYNNFYDNLFGLYINRAKFDARHNWWGSPLGPSLFEKITSRDRAFAKFGILRVFPWLFTKNNDAGTDWEIDYERFPYKINITRYKQIEFSETDTDLDGVPDWWEDKWGYNSTIWDDHANLDPDGDALSNIEECYTDEYGSNPYEKDIFVEVDWVKSDYGDVNSNKPTEYWIDELVNVFAEHDINIHIDDGRFGGGEYIDAIEDLHFEDLDDVYWDYFLNNDLNNPRKGIFHYCMVSDFGPYPRYGGFSIFGWDHLDSWVVSAERIHQNHPVIAKDRIVISVIMHELGHTMGLLADDHGGNDNLIATIPFTKQFFKYSAYRSIMNYMYTYSILDYSDGKLGRNDFDDWSNLDFGFFKDTNFDLPAD